MADLAALLVRIGADASSYLATTSSVSTVSSQFFGALRGMARGTTDELTNTLGVKLPAAFVQAQRGFEFFSAGMQTLNEKLKMTTNVSKFAGAQIAALSEGAFRGGLAIGSIIEPWVSAVTGLQEATSKLQSVNEEWVASLAGDEARYQQQLALYDRMRQKLGLVAEEWQVGSEATKENAARLARLTVELEKHQRTLQTTTQLQREHNTVALTADQVARRLREAIVSQDQALAHATTSLEQMYGVMTQETAHQRMEQILNDIALLATEGVSSKQVLERMGDEIESLGATADDLGMQIPVPFQDLLFAVNQAREGTDYYLRQTIDGLGKYLPEAADKAAAALRSSLGVAGDQLRDANGLLTEMGNKLSDIADGSWKVNVTVVADWTRYDAEAAARGVVGTSGQLP